MHASKADEGDGTTVLVTGLSGFVGRHLAQHLAAVDLADAAGWIDVRDAGRVNQAIAALRPQAVVHLAAQSSVPASREDPRQTYEVNFLGTLNLLQALRASHFRGRMLYVGSADIYGAVAPADLPITEDCPPRPLNPYAVSKAAAEALCYQWSRDGDFEIVIARPFNHIGPGQSEQFAVSDFARQAAACRKGRSPARLQVGDIDTTRDFTDVRDIVRAYASLLRDGGNGEIYNVCSGTERSLREVIGELSAICGVEMEIEVVPEKLRPAEQRRMRGSFAKLRRDTGWEPVIPFSRTLRDTLDYWMQKEET
jgi:GDP-4-dehydro-6-deoxy-D-mannose reductase